MYFIQPPLWNNISSIYLPVVLNKYTIDRNVLKITAKLYRFYFVNTALYFLWGRGLMGFFLEEPTELALDTGIMFLRVLSPFYFVVSAKLVADGILRGAGLMKQFMTATFTDLILRVALAFLLSGTALGATGIWCAWPVGWSVATAMSIRFYQSGIWNKKTQ